MKNANKVIFESNSKKIKVNKENFKQEFPDNYDIYSIRDKIVKYIDDMYKSIDVFIYDTESEEFYMDPLKFNGVDIMDPLPNKIILSKNPSIKLDGKQLMKFQEDARIYVDGNIFNDSDDKLLRHIFCDDSKSSMVESIKILVHCKVFLTFSTQGIPIKSSRRDLMLSNPVSICSIAGINLKYGDNNVKARYFANNGLTFRKNFSKDIKDMWTLIFDAMINEGIKIPLLCAIGSGAFCPKNIRKEVTEIYAEMLNKTLEEFKDKFDMVFMCITPYDTDLFKEYDKYKSNYITVKRSIYELANELASQNLSVAILNPSDVEATRGGKLGMYWKGGHIALEEILALTTTLTFQHISVYPDLWWNLDKIIKIY